MSEVVQPSLSALSLEDALQVERLCTRFESVWQRGERPRAEVYEAEVSATLWPVLLRELLALEMAFRLRDQDRPEVSPLRSLSADLTADFARAAGGAAASAGRGPVGEYEVLGELGQGGMGVVYRARQRGVGKVVALKMLRAGPGETPEAMRRLQSEARAVAALDHPHIVPLYAFGEQDGTPYFSMRLMEGGSLAQRLASAPLPTHEAARVLAKLALAVQYAHDKGIVHRDLKPANVLFDEQGEPHLADFGLAKHLRPDPQASATAGGVVGTACYMAPEQAAAGPGRDRPAVDVYGLGATLYEMLTGRPPFKASTFEETLRQVREARPARPSLINPQVDRALEAVCLMCLSKEPADRYSSAAELADDLDRYLKGDTTRAERACSGPLGRLLRSVTRYPDSRPEKLRTWSAISLWLAAVTFTSQVVVYALIRAGAGPLPFLLTDVAAVGLHPLVFWWFLVRRGHTLGPRGRQLVGLTLITLLGGLCLNWVRLPQALADTAGYRLTVYPSLMVISALIYTHQGRFWVGFYAIGGLFLAGAFAVGFWPEAGPLLYAVLGGGVSLGLGLFLRRQARRAAEAPRPESSVS
jgi:serine/threonine-protein kinase